LRYCLLASAGLAAIGLAFAVPPATAATPTCICQDPIRLPSKTRKPVAHRSLVRRPVRTAMAETYYDYRSASMVDTQPYTHHWEVAPQGFVPPPPVAMMGPPANDYAMMDGPPVPPGAPPAYGEGYQDGYAYGYQAGITIDQQGWAGGVGYTRSGGGGGGGGGGALTVAQPDPLNGPNYNSFNESFGGDYQSANQIDAIRQKALAPPTTSTTGTASH
jgi:hypothetical protein